MTLNALSRRQKFMRIAEKTAVTGSLIYANFNYCPLVWLLFHAKSFRKIENIQKSCLNLKLDDYKSDYEALIKKKGNSSMEIKRLRVLAIECFKTMNSIDPSYLKTHLPLNQMLRFAQVTLKLGIIKLRQEFDIKLLATATRF